MSKLNEFLTELKSTVEDFTQLNVRTFSGDLQASIGPVNGTAQLDENLENLDVLLRVGAIKGVLKLEASTTLKMDGDIDQFFSSNISSEMKQVHDTAVETGKASRNSIINFVKEIAE